jgi:carbonic anhydrase/acetyltransferase-like protein (isoleucine patch superfamily)
MTCYRLNDLVPTIDAKAYVAKEATVIGDVVLKVGATVWPGAVIRADNHTITIGAGSNVQDGAVLHTDDGIPLIVGENVTIGHQAMLHGCTVEDGALIGIQAVILNGAVIGKDSLVGAGALVTEGKVFPPRSLIVGSPAKVVRTLTDADIARIHENTASYVTRGQAYKNGLQEV